MWGGGGGGGDGGGGGGGLSRHKVKPWLNNYRFCCTQMKLSSNMIQKFATPYFGVVPCNM